ncbi:MAG: hypothetical protein ACM34A_01335 [Bacillota bacterium]
MTEEGVDYQSRRQRRPVACGARLYECAAWSTFPLILIALISNAATGQYALRIRLKKCIVTEQGTEMSFFQPNSLLLSKLLD